MQRETEYFTVDQFKTDIPFYTGVPTVVIFTFYLSVDTVTYRRQVYTVWEFFGDIGGLL